MHMAIVVLSVLLTSLFGFSGTTKVFNTTTARNNAAHLGISAGLSRMIGAAEIAAAIGLMAGLVIHPLAAVTAAAVCVLMAGGVSYHAKAKDKPWQICSGLHHRSSSCCTIVRSSRSAANLPGRGRGRRPRARRCAVNGR